MPPRKYEGTPKERQRISARFSFLKHKDKFKSNAIKRLYALERDEYDDLLSGPCSVCGTKDRPRVLDHDHVTGLIRGALCRRCNKNVDWYLRYESRLHNWKQETQSGTRFVGPGAPRRHAYSKSVDEE